MPSPMMTTSTEEIRFEGVNETREALRIGDTIFGNSIGGIGRDHHCDRLSAARERRNGVIDAGGRRRH